jgi:hypothetical protein
MAVTKQQIILEFDADTQGINKGLEQTEKSVDDVTAATSGLTNQLDKMTGGAITGFRKFSGGLKTAVSGLKSFKVALAATGVGLIVVAMGTLVSYFTSTKRGAEQLKVATEALGAAFSVIRDRISSVGGALVKFFRGDFKGALDDVKGAFTGITEEIVAETKAAGELQKRMNALKDEERDFNLVRAETNLAIAKTRLAVEDEAKSYDERIKALDTAIKLEQETIDEQLRLAKEREAIISAQVEQSESLEEDLQRQADARAAVIELETASLRTQKRLEGERQSLLLQRQAEQDRIAAEEAKRIEDEQKAREKEIEDERKAAEAKLKLEEKRLADEQKAKDEAAAKDKARRDKELADERALLEQKRAMTFAALSALNDLSNAFAKNDEEGARRAFKRNKALSLASAVLNTSQAITDALAKDATFPGSRFIAAATAGAAGLAQIQNIRKTQYQGSNPPPPATEDRGPAGGFATGAVNAPGAPTLDLGFLGEGAQGGPIQAYVIAQNVSNAQQANQQVQDQATLGG